MPKPPAPRAQLAFAPVLEWLRAGAPHVAPNGTPLVFDMEKFLDKTDCGTACCMAGAMTQFNPEAFPTISENSCPFLALTFISASLELDEEASTKLFYGVRCTGARLIAWEDMTPAQCAATLDHYLETGEVDWTLAPYEAEPA
jgi:hypothetical protein